MISRFVIFWKRSGWNEFVYGSAVLAFLLGAACFVLLASEAPGGAYLAWEERIMRSLRETADPAQLIGPWWVEEVVRDVSALGSATTLVTMTTLVLGYLLLRRGYATALLVIVATAGGYAISGGLKDWIARERPSVVPHLSQVSSESFPSGHSMLASVVYLTLGAILAESAARRREKVYFIQVALLLSVLIGVSRVFLGVHYPSDVFAGWAAGTAWALLCWSVADWLRRRGQSEAAVAKAD